MVKRGRRRLRPSETPTYALVDIHGALADAIPGSTTRRALSDSMSLGYTLPDVRRVLRDLRLSHFDKSMTSNSDPSVRQDVYKIVDRGVPLYIKVQMGPHDKLMLVSFHEDR